jgi:hypothetical protein
MIGGIRQAVAIMLLLATGVCVFLGTRALLADRSKAADKWMTCAVILAGATFLFLGTC